MFPLESVLLPGVLLPLHVFELRYRALVRACLQPGVEPEFGVVLIERGSEVGGGDVRTMIGSIARIIDARQLPDGRWTLVVAGTERIRVRRWLHDDPFPRAEIEFWPDAPATKGPNDLAEIELNLQRIMALRAELGDPTRGAPINLPSDVTAASYAAAALAPIGPADRQRLLGAAGPDERLELLGCMLEDELVFLRRRLELFSDGGPDSR
ncbi:MAG: LON peptidase substrate-binding domain-containing protein [Acidimicrobiales bacterium]|nr:LON peptidase substrate-binding domain-containing protein [Acidimicrobiales bacterium]